jgi:hypothetical protein
MLGKLAVAVFEGPMSAFACREGGKRFSGRNRTGYFPRPRGSRRWTKRLNLCRLMASGIRHLSSRSLCPYTFALNPVLADMFQSKLPCAQFLLRIQVFSNYRTKSCAIDTDAGYAKKDYHRNNEETFKCFAKKMASAVQPVIDIQFFRKITLAIICSSMQDDWYCYRMPELELADEHVNWLSPEPPHKIYFLAFSNF